jgi:hypothetical protein
VDLSALDELAERAHCVDDQGRCQGWDCGYLGSGRRDTAHDGHNWVREALLQSGLCMHSLIESYGVYDEPLCGVADNASRLLKRPS